SWWSQIRCEGRGGHFARSAPFWPANVTPRAGPAGFHSPAPLAAFRSVAISCSEDRRFPVLPDWLQSLVAQRLGNLSGATIVFDRELCLGVSGGAGGRCGTTLDRQMQ